MALSRTSFAILPLLACAIGLTAGEAKPAPEAKPKPYPLTTCIVIDEPLDSMGGAITKVYAGQEIKFCCRGCIPSFEKDQPKYLAKLTAKPQAAGLATPKSETKPVEQKPTSKP